ncbi:LysR family transcriptional regulator [Rhodococcoides fascians A21d2]|uniref:LysR family transcriptional regulator n=1 Tax=Nocardiaceae TaxID=85025 RepID=UPI00050C644E|nr:MULTISPECIES: LysR family transcriptional regulator [Rhodococcus]OZC49695.1 LysR family transcriptional regulator [Rhodococcus sp. WWJCD1]QIH98783.1 LysR family transcriptional regulator [Rhodococcus fascians A21d2]
MPLPPHVADLTSIDLLLSVAELGSIGRAGRAHGMSQPAASSRIRALERRVGAPLLKRGARGTVLTEFGELVASWAAPVVRSAEDLATAIAALHAERIGHVQIAASQTVAEYLLPRWLVTLHAHLPHIVPTLSSGNSTVVAEKVLAGSADIGFIESPGLPAGLDHRTMATDELVLVVPPGHAWVSTSPTASEIVATALVTRETGSGTRSAYENALAAAGLGEPTAPLLEVSSTTAIKSAVGAGIGGAVLSSLAVAPELAAGTLIQVPIPGLTLRRELRAIWPSGRIPTGPAAELLAVAAKTQP